MSFGSMDPAAALQCFASLCDFVLEASLACCLCWALARFAVSPTIRFALWVSFLLGSAAAWIVFLCRAYIFTVHARVFPAGPQASPPSHTGAGWAVTEWAARAICSALPLAACVYLCVLCVLAAGFLARQRRLRGALAFRNAAPPALHGALRALAHEMSIGVCQLWLLPGLPSPATTGWRTPCIYLPPECRSEDELALENILRHELAHVRRLDMVWEAAARLCRAALFFHPAVHIAFAALRLQRELACDLVVLRARPAKRDVYADVLVRYGWRTLGTGRRKTIGIAFAASAAVLHARVQAILAGEASVSPVARSVRGLLSAFTLCLAVLLAPALWVGFHLPAARLNSAAAAEPPSSARHHARRVKTPARLAAAPARSFEAPTTTPVFEADHPILLPSVAPAPLRVVEYHNQAPVLPPEKAAPPETSAESSPGSPVPGASPRKRARCTLPATVTALVGAAIALHGLHDHEHTHE